MVNNKARRCLWIALGERNAAGGRVATKEASIQGVVDTDQRLSQFSGFANICKTQEKQT